MRGCVLGFAVGGVGLDALLDHHLLAANNVGLDACPALESAAPTDAQCAALGATLDSEANARWDTNATSALDSSVNAFTGLLLDYLLSDQ